MTNMLHQQQGVVAVGAALEKSIGWMYAIVAAGGDKDRFDDYGLLRCCDNRA